MRSLAAALATIALAALLPQGGDAASRRQVKLEADARAALADLAARVTHGWADHDLTYEQMEARLVRGLRLRNRAAGACRDGRVSLGAGTGAREGTAVPAAS